jgi:hypothetical protein
MGAWDQQSLANSFSTMALTPSAVIDWVAYSGASNHATSDVGNLISVHPPNSTDPSSIIVGNESAIPVTSETRPFPVYFTLIMSFLLQILFKKNYSFIVSQPTIDVPWSLTHLAFL